MGARSRRVPPRLLLTSATMCRVQVCYAMAVFAVRASPAGDGRDTPLLPVVTM